MRRRFALLLPSILGVTLCGCSFCPPETVERGKKGDEQWCEAKGPEGVFVKQGPYRSWHSNGKLSRQGQFLGGKGVGHWIAYEASGEKSWEKSLDDNGDLIGIGKFYKNGRDLVAEPDLSSPTSTALSFVVAMNLGDADSLSRVMGPDYAADASVDCSLKKKVLNVGQESCEPGQILGRLHRFQAFARRSQLSTGKLKEASPTEAKAEILSENYRGEVVDNMTIYKKSALWRPAQVPPEMLIPNAFKTMSLGLQPDN